MRNLIAGTNFERSLNSVANRMTDHDHRKLVFAYCQCYQDDYSFDQLATAFSYLETALTDDAALVIDELTSVRSDVEIAVGEYFESLNEVAMAVQRLLDTVPFTVNDTVECICHVLNAHACNEAVDDFRSREDNVLCALLERFVDSKP